MKTALLSILLLLQAPDAKIIKKLKVDGYSLSDYKNALVEMVYLQDDTVFFKNYLRNVQLAKRSLDDNFSIIRKIRT